MRVIDFDIDGVLADQVSTYVGYARENYETSSFNGTVDHLNPVLTDCGRSFIDIVGEVYEEEPSLIEKMDAIPGSIKAVNDLYNKYDVQLVTHRPKSVREETVNWLNNHGFKYDDLIMGEDLDKTSVGGYLIVEDFVSNAVKYAKAGKTAIVFNHHYNHHEDISEYPNIINIADKSPYTRRELVEKPEVQWTLIWSSINGINS